MASPRKKPQRQRSHELISTNTQRGHADRLYRDAAESVRQRERYARLVDVGAHDAEQTAALQVACLCDEVLLSSVKNYEAAASGATAGTQDEWARKANSLWHASREYQRRHAECDQRSSQFGATHSASHLGELTMQYDLEASALLALRMSLASYQSCCPDAELKERPQTFVA
ncbi:MAG: hypothetical protein ABI877_22025 [Gemmatimonadaceae bacterium]